MDMSDTDLIYAMAQDNEPQSLKRTHRASVAPHMP